MCIVLGGFLALLILFWHKQPPVPSPASSSPEGCPQMEVINRQFE